MHGIHPADILHFVEIYKYPALLILAILEGPIVALLAGFLVKTGFLALVPTIIMLILGDLPDSLYYLIGKMGQKKAAEKNLKVNSKLTVWIKKMWDEHPTKAMFVTKLAYGLSIPLLITAGSSNIPYKKFIWRAVLVTIFQYGLLMSIGFLLGNAYASAVKYVHEAEIGITLLVILAIGIFFYTEYKIRSYVITHE